MEQIKEANEERDHLKAVNTQLQEEIAALKHEVCSSTVFSPFLRCLLITNHYIYQ